MLRLSILPTRLPSHVFFGKPTVMAVYITPVMFLRRTVALAVACSFGALLSLPEAYCQEPVIDRLDVANFRPGQKATVVVNGKQLMGASGLWTPVGTLRPKEGTDLTKDQAVTFEGDIKADAIPGIYPARMVTNHGCSEAGWLVVDDLPSVALAPESQDRTAAQLITLPCCVAGQINPVLSRFFRVALTAGQSVSVEVLARRLGSDLDPVIRVTGPNGSEVAYRDDLPGAEGDTQLQFTAAVDGEHRIELRDVRFSGGARHFFHLRMGKLTLASATMPRVTQAGGKVSLIGSAGEVVGETAAQISADLPASLVPVSFRSAESDASTLGAVLVTAGVSQNEVEPNNARTEATALAPESEMLTGSFNTKGDSDWFKISVTEPTALLVVTRTRELNSPTDVMLELYNSEGGKVAENDDVGLRDAELTFMLPAAGDYFLKVGEIAGRGGSEWIYALDVFRGRKAVKVTAPADRINVPRGGNAAMLLAVRRIHYDGPLKVEAVGLPAALTMTPFTIGGKQSAVPIVLTAKDPAAAASDADWGPVTLRVSAPDGVVVPPAEIQLAPPAPKKTDAELFRSARVRADLFTAVQPAAQFSLLPEPSTINVTQGASATILLKSTRIAEWTEPIEIALSTPADQLPAGVTVTGGSMVAGELAVTIAATADAPVGPFTVFLQGKSKKDKVEPVHPVPPIVVEVVPK
jgi:hypothetical protein